MGVKSGGSGHVKGNKPISQLSTVELERKLANATGRIKVNILNELTKRGA